MVLHMLRRLVGDDAFFAGLRGFYTDWRFRKAGTDDLRKAMERAAGRSLERFFEDWIFGDAIPSVSFYYKQIDEGSATLRFEQRGAVMEFPLTVKVTYGSDESEDRRSAQRAADGADRAPQGTAAASKRMKTTRRLQGSSKPGLKTRVPK
jgi:aminopeptidase N